MRRSPSLSNIIDFVAIGTVLASMLAANAEWAFTRPDWLDTWMYFGFFQHYDAPGFLAGNKKIARLPWILLGYVVNRLFSPTVAALVLHVGCLALGAFFLFKVVQALFGRPAAIIATLTYLTWVPGHGSGGWDYHNTVLPVFYFAAYRALLWASDPAARRRFIRFAVFGALFALALHTNVLTALLIPALLLRCAFLHRNGSLEVSSIAPAFGGAILITIGLCAINAAVGRGFFFPGVLFARSLFLIEHPAIEKSWWLPWSSPWWTSNINMPMINAVLVLVVLRALMSYRRWSWQNLVCSSSACAMAECVITFALFAIGQTLGHPLLQPYYMAMPLTMPMFVALGALVADIVGAEGGIWLGLFAALAFGVQFVGRLSLDPDFFRWQPGAWTSDILPVSVTCLGFVIAALLSRTSWRMNKAAAFVCLALFLGQTNMLWPIAGDDRAPYDYRNASCKTHEALLVSVKQSDDVLFAMQKRGYRIALWYSANESSGSPACHMSVSQVGRALSAMGYGGLDNARDWDPEANAEITPRVVDALTRSDILALITNDAGYVSRALSVLKGRNPAWNDSSDRVIGVDGITVALHLISLDRIAP